MLTNCRSPFALCGVWSPCVSRAQTGDVATFTFPGNVCEDIPAAGLSVRCSSAAGCTVWNHLGCTGGAPFVLVVDPVGHYNHCEPNPWTDNTGNYGDITGTTA